MGWKTGELGITAKQGQESFLSSAASRLALELTHSVDAGVKLLVHEHDHSSSSSGKVKYLCSCTSTSEFIIILSKKNLHKLHSEIYSLITTLRSSYKDVCQKVVDHRISFCNQQVLSLYGL
jgi:hypothetical protein